MVLVTLRGIKPCNLAFEVFSERGACMRLDKYLKNSRLIKRRTVANAACDQGRVKINGKVAKAGTEVKIGDIIEIEFGNSTAKVQVSSISENVSKAQAKEMYKIVD